MADFIFEIFLDIIAWGIIAFLIIGSFCACLMMIIGFLGACGWDWANKNFGDEFGPK